MNSTESGGPTGPGEAALGAWVVRVAGEEGVGPWAGGTPSTARELSGMPRRTERGWGAESGRRYHWNPQNDVRWLGSWAG